MKKLKNKTAVTTIALILMLTMAAFMIVMPAVQAQGPGTKLQTWLLISANPNPVGVGQPLYVNAFMSKPTITASTWYGDRYQNIKVEITRPDGTKETYGPYMADPTGGIWFTYVPAKTGNYTLQAFYPGQILTGDNPNYPNATYPGLATAYNYVGSEYLPTESTKLTIAVQEAPVTAQYQSPPLPTEYWSRPIYATNWGWAQLGGNWFGLRASGFSTTGVYDAEGSFMPYTTAPNTGHILWTKPTKFGGQVGAPTNADQQSQYESTSILWRQWEPIILYGILYYVHYPTTLEEPASWIAVDLRTGEEVWKTPCGITGDELLRYGQTLTHHTIQEYGSAAYLWSVPRIGTTRLRLYDANTGMYLAEINGTDTQDLTMIADFDCTYQGTLLGWYTSGSNLVLWNSTKAFFNFSGSLVRGTLVRDIRVLGNTTWASGIQWSVPRNFQIGGVSTGNLGIGARTREVILLRNAPDRYSGYSAGYQVTVGIDAKTGDKLWGPLNQTIPEAQGAALSSLAARDGVYVLHGKDKNQVWGYSLKDGKYLWGPVKLPGNAWSHISVAGNIAYGNVYIWDYGGMLYCLDQDTGEIKWTFTRGSAGYDTPYGIYPFWTYQQSIVDGKLFMAEGHLYDPPLNPSKLLAINATTGELIWDTLFYGARMNAAHADSMFVIWNSFDNQIYCFGKGQTATTVAASPKVSVHGSSVLVEGMVTDESAGTKNSDRVARFPNGVPAVSDASMSAWMEYVYMQQSRPTNATGVEVTLDTIDPNNNFIHIGTVTTDTSGAYSCMWTPEVPGKYIVFATFAGSKSYWASYAETAIGVEEAPPATPPPQYPVPVDTTLTIIGTGIAIIIAVAIVGIMIVRLLRKRP